MIKNLEQAIAGAYQRLENLSLRAGEIGPEDNSTTAVLEEAIGETAISLEELEVLAEELTQQNQELVATRHLLEVKSQCYQDLFNFAPDGYLLTDVNGVIQEANYAAAQLLHVRQSYLIGKPLAVFLHQTELPKFYQIIGQLRQQTEKHTQQLRIFHQEGKIDFVAEFTLGVAQDYSQAKIKGLRWLFRDISDRLQAEEKIRQQVALLDMTTDAILIRDLHNEILYWNQGAANIYGWRAEEVIGKNTWEIFSPEASPQLLGAMETVLKDGSWCGELRTLTKKGKKIIVNSRWTLMYSPTGLPQSIMSMDTDITEKKQLEIELLRTQRLSTLGTLTHAIADDLHNIFAPMIIVAELLPLQHPELNQSSLEMLKLLASNSKLGMNLVQQIQSFTSHIQPQGSIASVSHLIQEVEQTIKSISPKPIDIHIDIPIDLTVLGDQTELHELLVKLLVNVCDAIPEASQVRISAQTALMDDSHVKTHRGDKVGFYIVITVTHTGATIHPQIIDEIFTPFTSQPWGKNSTIGRLVTVSTQVGVGSELRIYIPCIKIYNLPRGKQGKLPIGNQELILVVDQETAITQITKTTLEIHNYRVLIATSGIEALALYTQHQQDIKLVLIDMMIPLITGENTIHTLQIINPEVHIIAMSQLATVEALTRTDITGIRGFLAKPFTAEQLLNVIHDALVSSISSP
jgi:two-component system cell cycle sensor histidine kinase/response regulator CckA